MLNALRNQASRWLIRGFLVVLALSFALWGIGDVFRARGPTEVVAEVEGMAITEPALRREADLAFDQIQRQFGGAIPRDESIMASFRQRALEGAIARRLVEAHALDLGLTVSDAVLADRIRSQPSFQTADQFDRSRFELFLRSSGLTEAQFLEQVRLDLLRDQLLQGMLAPVQASETAASTIDAYEGELRTGEALVVAATAQPLATPDDNTLETFRAAREAEFQKPELRTVQLATLNPEDLVDEVGVDEDEVRAAYEVNLDRYRSPEQRTAVQLLAPSREVIDEAARRVANGESFEPVAAEMAGSGLTLASLGGVQRDALPEPLEDTLFAMNPGEVSAPVETAFGWHLLRLDQVAPETVQPFDAVRGDIEHEFRLRKAADQLPQTANAFEDALAGGADLGSAAGQVGARMETVTIDRNGVTAEGSRPEGLTREMLGTIFASPEGETSLLQTSPEGGYYVYHVGKVEPARPETLEEARLAITTAWQRQQQLEAARTAAESVLQQAHAGSPLETLTGQVAGGQLVKLGPVRRDADPASLPLGPAVQTALFATAPGKVADQVTDTPSGAAVLKVNEVVPADPIARSAETMQRLQAEMRNDLAQSYERALRERYTVKVNDAAAASFLRSPQP